LNGTVEKQGGNLNMQSGISWDDWIYGVLYSIYSVNFHLVGGGVMILSTLEITFTEGLFATLFL
jgi:hypothetical protein